MKLTFTLLIITLAIGSSSFTGINSPSATANTNSLTAADAFDFFRIHRQGKDGITAVWGFTASSAVSGFLLEKTYQDPSDPYAFWETVTLMSASDARSYKFTDVPVSPGYISYRVTAILASGTEISSSILTYQILSH